MKRAGKVFCAQNTPLRGSGEGSLSQRDGDEVELGAHGDGEGTPFPNWHVDRSIRQTQPWSKFNIWLLRSAKWSTLPFSCLIARTPYLCYFPLLRKLDSKYKLSKLFRSWWFRFREWCLAKALERCKGETVPIPPFLHCLGEIAERPNGILSQSSRLVDEG